jgi:hypothetical protein
VVSAQTVAASLDDLKGIAIAGSTVKVTDGRGQEVEGKLAEVSMSGLSLRVGNAVRRFEANDVRRVRVRKEDSVLNGALIGAAIAGRLTSLIFLDNECADDPSCLAAVFGNAGIWALAGMGVDALIHRDRVVYSAPSGSVARSIDVAPVVSPAALDFRVTMKF